MLTFLSPSEHFAAICHFRLLFASLLPLSLVENSLKEQFQLSCEQIEAADHKLNIGQGFRPFNTIFYWEMWNILAKVSEIRPLSFIHPWTRCGMAARNALRQVHKLLSSLQDADYSRYSRLQLQWQTVCVPPKSRLRSKKTSLKYIIQPHRNVFLLYLLYEGKEMWQIVCSLLMLVDSFTNVIIIPKYSNDFRLLEIDLQFTFE